MRSITITKNWHQWIVPLILISAIMTVDQITKVQHTVRNTGGLFGLFTGYNHIYIIASIVVLAILIWKFEVSEQVSYSMLIAGILSNLVDRAYFGYVRDFIDVKIWPVFNIADVAITTGILLLVWKELRSRNG